MATKEIWFQQSGLKGADTASKWSGRREFGTTASKPSPPRASRAMKNITSELRGGQHGIHACLPRTSCPLGDNAAKLKACCQSCNPNPVPWLLPGNPAAQRRGLPLWQFGYPLMDSCTTLDLGPAHACGQRDRGLMARDEDAERAWAVILAGAADASPALCMKSPCSQGTRMRNWSDCGNGAGRASQTMSVRPRSTRWATCHFSASLHPAAWFTNTMGLLTGIYLNMSRVHALNDNHFIFACILLFTKEKNPNKIIHEVPKFRFIRQKTDEAAVKLRLNWEFGKVCWGGRELMKHRGRITIIKRPKMTETRAKEKAVEDRWEIRHQ